MISLRVCSAARSARGGAGFAMRGQDVEAEIALTLEEAHRGVKRNITLQVMETVHGLSRYRLKDGKTVCPTCRGAGFLRRPKSLEVMIPAGVRDGSVIRLAGQGEPGANGAPAGDLFLHVRIQPHRLFNIVGENDVQIELPVAPWEAALGSKYTGADARWARRDEDSAGAQGGQRLRLRGQGLNRRGGGRGDEYVKLKIVNPPKLDAQRERAFREARRRVALQCAGADDGRLMMTAQRYEIVLYRREPQQLTLDMLAGACRHAPGAGRALVEFGLIEPVETARRDIAFRCLRGAAAAHDRPAPRISGYQSRGRCGRSGFARSILRPTARERNAA